MNDTQHYYRRLSKGDVGEVIKTLDEHYGNNNAEITNLHAYYDTLVQSVRRGIISNAEYQKSLNRVTSSVMGLLNGLKDFSEKQEYPNAQAPNKTVKENQAPYKSQKRSVFISYSHHDKEYAKDLQQHLKGLEREGKIGFWQDNKILPGQEWNEAIKENLYKADIIMFLISADYLAADYMWREELQIAIKRVHEKEAVIVPIIVRPCLWTQTDFAKFQVMPIDPHGRLTPVCKWDDEDDAMKVIVKEIDRMIERL